MTCAAVVFAIFVAFGLRMYRIDISWDIFIDELYYLDVSRGVSNTLWVNEADGDRFYLHPPLLFFVEAAYMKLFSIRGDLFEQVYGVRYIGAAFAGLSAGALLWLGRRLAGWPAGLAAAMIFALDPFSIRMNTRNLLDTPAVMWVLLGYSVLFAVLLRGDHRPVSWWRGRLALQAAVAVSVAALALWNLFLGYAMIFGTLEEQYFYYLVIPSMLVTTVTTALVLQKVWAEGTRKRPTTGPAARRPHGGRRERLALQAAAGVLFGLALLTKEPSAFVTLLPLGICFVLGWALPRIQSALVGIVALVVYAPYLAIIYAIGDWDDFVHQKFMGFSRLAGFVQITGFNQQGGPSFLDAIVSRLDEFATTYVLLVTGAVAVCVLLLTDLGKTPARRLLVAWISSAYAFLGYAMIFGTLEEQYFYYLVIPSMLVTTVTTALVLQKVWAEGTRKRPTTGPAARRPHGGRRERLALQAAAAICVAALTLWNSYVWLEVHTVPDNAYERVVSYVDDLPRDSRVAVTEETGEFLVKEHVYGRSYSSVEAMKADNIDYVVINSYLATEGYNAPPLEVYRWVKNHGRLVYAFEYRSSGLLGVWRLQEHVEGAMSGSKAVARGSGAREEPQVTEPRGTKKSAADS